MCNLLIDTKNLTMMAVARPRSSIILFASNASICFFIIGFVIGELPYFQEFFTDLKIRGEARNSQPDAISWNPPKAGTSRYRACPSLNRSSTSFSLV